MSGHAENNTGVGSRANHAAHAFSGVVEKGRLPAPNGLGSPTLQAQQTAAEPKEMQAGLRTYGFIESSRVIA